MVSEVASVVDVKVSVTVLLGSPEVLLPEVSVPGVITVASVEAVSVVEEAESPEVVVVEVSVSLEVVVVSVEVP